MATINCNGHLIDLSTPRVMGIVNVTPDSFYDGGRLKTDQQILNQVNQMLTDGASFIDIGGQSTRPNADLLTANQELKRVAPIVELLIKAFPNLFISIDTFHSSVANTCLDLGACMINDITGAEYDKNMLQVIANHQVPYCIMHTKGTPQTMQNHCQYEDISKEILFYFSKKIATARSFGINDLIVDPGFGFAKTIEQNFDLLSKLELLQNIELPILVGVSRKSMVYKTLNIEAKEALNGTTVLHTIALNKGASILRVHDVKEAIETIQLVNKIS